MTDPTPGALACLVAGARQHLHTAEGFPWAEHLPARVAHAALRQLGGASRQRLCAPALTPWAFRSQPLDPDHPCRQAVARPRAASQARGRALCSPRTGACCKARRRLPEALLARLTRGTGRQALEAAGAGWPWKRRAVRVVDGASIPPADTPANQRAYPRPASQKPGLGSPSVRLVVVSSPAVGTASGAAFGRWQGR